MRTRLALLLLGLTTLVVFWSMREQSFLNMDDGIFVTENPFVRGGLSIKGIRWAFLNQLSSDVPGTDYWSPLAHISHMVDFQIYGTKPAGHYLTNLLIHVGNVALAFLLLRRLGQSFWACFLIAVLFAIHPLNVESVAWLIDRKVLLSTFCALGALLGYVRYAEMPSGSRLVLVVALYLLSFTAKALFLTLPLLLLILDFWPLRRISIRPSYGIGWRMAVEEKVPIVLVSSLGFMLTLISMQGFGSLQGLDVIRFSSRLFNASISLVSYLSKMLWPVNLCVWYPHPGNSFSAIHVLVSIAILSAISWIALKFARRMPCLLAGWLWFLVSILPVLGLVQGGHYAMADRHTYFPFIGIWMMLCLGVEQCLPVIKRHIPALNVFRWAGGLAIIWIGCLTLVTHRQLLHWRDSESLFSHALNVSTGNYIAHNNLGAALKDKLMLKKAEDHFVQALEINPHYAEAWSNLGSCRGQQGDLAGAIFALRRGLQENPGSAETWNNLGTAFSMKADMVAAGKYYKRALCLQPDFADVHFNLGNNFLDEGRLNEAIAEFRKAAATQSIQDGETHYKLALCMGLQGQMDESNVELAVASGVNPRIDWIQRLKSDLVVLPLRWHVLERKKADP